MISEKEIQFLDRIDCNFPYLNKEKSIELIKEASLISSNALFSIIEEICRVPKIERQNVSNEILFELLSLTESKLDHPLKSIIIETAKNMINEQDLEVCDIILKMKMIKDFPQQYAALSIVYNSCHDEYDKLEPLWEDILNTWKK